MTDHIKGSITDLKIMTDGTTLTVVLKLRGELQVFADSRDADSLLKYLADHGIVISAKADDAVVISTFHGGDNGTARDYILVYEFTLASKTNSPRPMAKLLATDSVELRDSAQSKWPARMVQ